MKKTKRNCDNCGKTYFADNRNLKRGWGLCCSKSCSASKREKSRPNYDPVRATEMGQGRRAVAMLRPFKMLHGNGSFNHSAIGKSEAIFRTKNSVIQYQNSNKNEIH